MRSRNASTRRNSSTRGSGPGIPVNRGREWVGGRILAPAYVTDGEPYRVELLLWLELPDELVLGVEVLDPRAPTTIVDSLLRAMQRPAVGPPRRPDRVRVADAALASELRAAVPGLEIVVASTPELDATVAEMMETMEAMRRPAAPESYFEQGRLPLAVLSNLFRVAAPLYKRAPWKVAHDGQVLRLDIPQLGVEGACVSLIGMLGQSLGFLIFPSLAQYLAFRRNLDAPRRERVELGTTILGLTFEHGADLPTSMRQEVKKYGWPLAGPRAYPRVEHRDSDGLPRPLSEQDVRIATACAAALDPFFARHRSAFQHESPSPAAETYTDDSGLTVRLTIPCGTVGLSKERAAPGNAPSPRPRGASAFHELDERLVGQLLAYAHSRFGPALLHSPEVFADAEAAAPLAVPWFCYCARIRGKTLAASYLEEHGGTLPAAEREWLAAQQLAWLSVWEVLSVDPGRSVTVQDLLTGEQRKVAEVSASRLLAARDAILARVVEPPRESVFCGTHPRPLPPLSAAQVVARVRAKLRKRTAVPIERLREESIGRFLIACWEEAAEELDRQRAMPPLLQNTDGDELVMTIDHFAFAPAVRGQIAAALAAMSDVEPPEDDGATYVFLKRGNPMHKSWENTVIGRAELAQAELRLSANSVRRADALRARVQTACSGLLRHRARTHSDPGAERGPRAHLKEERETAPSPQEAQLVQELKARHYAEWVDQPVPALGGQTPRQAMRTKRGREQVRILLKAIENHESRSPAATRFDFSALRTELRLD